MSAELDVLLKVKDGHTEILNEIRDLKKRSPMILEGIKELRNDFRLHESSDKESYDRIQDDLKSLSSSISERLDKYNSQLEVHIKGTETNEKRVSELQAKLIPIVEKYQEDLISSKIEKKMQDDEKEKAEKKYKKLTIIVGIFASIVASAPSLIGMIVDFFKN